MTMKKSTAHSGEVEVVETFQGSHQRRRRSITPRSEDGKKTFNWIKKRLY